MKKIIGILGVAVFAMAMFFSTNATSSSDGNLNLASLITLNTANAESCIGANFRVISIPGGWHCQNNAGSSCCPLL